MFSDSQLSKNVTGYDRNAKISAFRDLIEHMFTTHIKDVSSIMELEKFMKYTDSVFDFVLKEHAISRDELGIDMIKILKEVNFSFSHGSSLVQEYDSCVNGYYNMFV